MVKPDAYQNMGKIIDTVLANGFTITRALMLRLSEDMVYAMFPEEAQRP